MSAKLKKCQKIDRLIQKRATGTPAQLADKVGVCETYAKKLVAYMRSEFGMPILYTRHRGYIYTRKGHWFNGWIDEEE